MATPRRSHRPLKAEIPAEAGISKPELKRQLQFTRDRHNRISETDFGVSHTALSSYVTGSRIKDTLVSRNSAATTAQARSCRHTAASTVHPTHLDDHDCGR
jgi:hypothetical protein